MITTRVWVQFRGRGRMRTRASGAYRTALTLALTLTLILSNAYRTALPTSSDALTLQHGSSWVKIGSGLPVGLGFQITIRAALVLEFALGLGIALGIGLGGLELELGLRFGRDTGVVTIWLERPFEGS